MYTVAISGAASKREGGAIEIQWHEGPVRQCSCNEFMLEKGSGKAQGTESISVSNPLTKNVHT
jgi:hypothetical protein